MIPNGAIPVRSRRVLLIENSPSDRQLLRNWLASEMIETHEAVDIITAIAVCQKVQPNLVLLQLRLNTWDGYEVIKRLKDDPKTRSIPVIFLAASALTAEKAKGIDMGAVDFVSKPFDSVELLARVNSALRTKALLDLLEQRAHLDGLTELGNRFALSDMLPLTVESCRARNRPLSYVIADLDHFKKVNDQYGHAAGDEVLRRMGMVLRCVAGPTDFVARYGGEEFVVVCPDRDLAAATELARQIRQGVEDMRATFRNNTIPTTASVGVAHIPPGEVIPHTELMERADQSLYRAKSAGRNTIWHWDIEQKKPVATPPPAPPAPAPAPAPPAAAAHAPGVTAPAPAAKRPAPPARPHGQPHPHPHPHPHPAHNAGPNATAK